MVGTEIARLYATLDADTRAFEQALKRSDSLISGVGNTLGTFVKVGIGAAVVGMGAFAAGIGSALAASAAFDKTMSGAKAILGATAEEMDGLNKLAMQLGKDTVFSAAEAGKAIEMLGQDGLNVQQIMGGAAKATVDLAAATGTDLTNAANIASKAMKAFDIPAEQMQTAINGIAGAANINGLTINGYAQAIAMAGGVAAQTGVSFDDFNATIAAIIPVMSGGSDAGTSFKNFLLRLIPQSEDAADAMKKLGLFTGLTGDEYDKTKAQIAKLERELAGLDPTSKNYEKRAHDIKGQIDALNSSLKTGRNAFFNADGSMKDMSEIADVLQNSLSGLSDAAKGEALNKIFGTDAIRVATQLGKLGKSGFADIANKLAKSDAAKMASTRMDNLAGDVEQLSGSFDTLKIAIGQAFTPLARKVVQFITTNLNKLLGFDFKPFAARFDAAWERVQAVIQHTVTLFDRFSSKTRGGLPSILDALGQTFTEWAGSIWSWIEPGITSAFMNLVNWIRNPGQSSTLAQSLEVAWNFFSLWAGAIWNYVWPKLGELFSAITSWITEPDKRTRLFNAIVAAWNVFADWAGQIWAAVSPYLAQFWGWLSSWVTDPAKRTELYNGIVVAWDVFSTWAKNIATAVTPFLSDFWAWLSGWVTDPAKRTQLYNGIATVWSWFTDWAVYIGQAVAPLLESFWSWLTSWVTDSQKRTTLWNGIVSVWSFFWDWGAYIVDAVTPYLSQFWAWLSGWVTDPTKRNLLWTNITTTWTGFTDWASTLWFGSGGKNGVQQHLLGLWASINDWLLKNVPQLGPWEDAFSHFITAAHDEWIKKFPEMQSNFTLFYNSLSEQLKGLGKDFADMWDTIFGKINSTSAGQNGQNFISGLQTFLSTVEGTIVNSLKLIRLLVEAMDYGLKAWKAGLSFNLDEYMSNAALFMDTIGRLGQIKNLGDNLVPIQPGNTPPNTTTPPPSNGYNPNDPNAVVDQSSQGPGHRASGGNVLAGMRYLTAEHGQGELFVPKTNGYIYNAGDTAQILRNLGTSTNTDNSTTTTQNNDYTYNSSDASALTANTAHRIELIVSGESNLPRDRASLRELSILLAREMNLSGAVLTMS